MPDVNQKKWEDARSEHAKLCTEYQAFVSTIPEDFDKRSSEQQAELEKRDADLVALEETMNALKIEVERGKRTAARKELEFENDARDLRDDPEGFQRDAEIEQRQLDAFNVYCKNGERTPMATRAMLAGDQQSIGYLLPPNQIVEGILKDADDAHMIRQKATTRTVPESVDLGIITLKTDFEDFEWTTEIKEPTEGTDLELGERHWIPHPAEKLHKLSAQLVRSTPRAEQLVRERIVYVQGNTQEKAFMTGDGNKKPLGIFTQSNDGIDSSRWYSTHNTATAIKATNLIGAQGELKSNYRGEWMLHRDVLTMIRGLKDGNGQFIFRPGLDMGVPPSLLGDPYTLSEFCPNTFTTGLPVYAYGDFSKYWIVDALNMRVQVFVEKWGPKYIGYYWIFSTDGQPALAEAFVIGALA